MAIVAAELVVRVTADMTQLTAGLQAANEKLRQFAGVGTQTATVAAQQIGSAFSNASSTVSVAAVNMTKSAAQAAAASAKAVQQSAVDTNNGIINIIGKISITNKAAAAATKAALTDTERAAIAAGQAITTNIGGSGTAAFRGLASTIGPVAVGILAVTAVVVGLGYAIEKVTSTFAKYGFELYKLNQVTGINVQSLQVLTYGAELTGSSMAGLQRGLIYLSKQIELAATDNKQATARLHELGVETSDYKGKADALLLVLTKIAQKFEDTTNGYQKAALASKLLSRFGGSDLIVMFNQLGSNLEPFLRDLERFGLLLDNEGIAKAKAMEQESIKLGLAWKGLEVQLGQQLYPVIIQVVGAFEDFIVSLQDIVPFVSTVVTTLDPLLGTLWDIVKVLGLIHEQSTISSSIGIPQYKGDQLESFTVDGMKRVPKRGVDKQALQQMLGDFLSAANKYAAASSGKLENPTGDIFKDARNNPANQAPALFAQMKALKEQILSQSEVSFGGGAGTLEDIATAKKKNDGSDALRRSAEALAKQESADAIKAFKEQMEDEKAIQDEAYADRSISAATYYDSLRTIALKTYKEGEDAIMGVIDLLKNDQFAAQEKVNAALETGSTEQINKALTQLNEINSRIAEQEGRLHDANRQTQQSIATYYKEAIKAALEFQKAMESENEELLKTQGGTATFQAQRLAAEHEFAEFNRKWHAEADAAAAKLNSTEEDSVQIGTQEFYAANRILAIKKQLINLAEQSYLNQYEQNSAAQDEVYIRQKISLGLISDVDAQTQINNLGRQRELALAVFISQFQQLDHLTEDQVIQLKEAINQLNKMKELDLSPLQRLFKGLIDSTKTFEEEFGDAMEQLGKDLHSSLSTAFQTLLKGDFKGFLSSLVTGFRDAIAKMVADLLASRLLKILADILQDHFGIKLTLDTPQTVATIANTTAMQAATTVQVALDANLNVLNPQVTELTQIAVPNLTTAIYQLIAALQTSSGGSAGSAIGGAAAGAGGFFSSILHEIGNFFGGGGSTNVTIGNYATGGFAPPGSMYYSHENELNYAMPGGGTQILNSAQSRKKSGGGGTIEIHNHYWNVQTPTPQAFAGRPSQLQVERQAAKSVSRGRRNS